MSEAEKDGATVSDTDDLVAVAHVVRVRGLRGEVVADLLTDFPERFEGLERLISVTADGLREVLTLEDHWLQSGRVVFKFAGYDTIEAARALVGREMAVPEQERVQLQEDEYYDWELAGCRVETVHGDPIGQVSGVMHPGSTDLLIVQGQAGDREHLIPLADEICVEIDIEGKLIRIDAPDGLLEL